MSTCQLFKVFRRTRRNCFVVLLLSLLSTVIVIQTVILPEQFTSNWNISDSLLGSEFNDSTTDYSLPPNYDELNVSQGDEYASPSSKWLRTLKETCASQSNSHTLGFSADCSHPVLTMFTTMDIANVNRTQVHNNTIINWSSLGPCVKLILFVDKNDSLIAQLATRKGWVVETVPLKMHDIPVLRSMYLSSFKLSSTPLYLYANADILFDNSLIQTTFSLLCTLKRETNQTNDIDYLQRRIFDKGIFAVGRRTNVPLTKLKSVLPDSFSVFRKDIHPFRVYAEDYFITTSGPLIGFQNSTTVVPSSVQNNAGHFPWEKVPNFVIGRPAYDNWLVAQALRWNVTFTVDLSRTVLAVHQTGVDGIRSGFTALRNNATLHSNFQLAGKTYKFEQGVTSCLPWFSFVTQKGDIKFLARKHRKRVCTDNNYSAPRRGRPPAKRIKPAPKIMRPVPRPLKRVMSNNTNIRSPIKTNNLANRRYSLILEKRAHAAPSRGRQR